MKKRLQGVVLGTILGSGLMSVPAVAEQNELEISANVGFYSKYIWRGWELNSKGTIQGGFDLAYDGFYAGIWGGSDETLGSEIDLYGGYGHTFSEYFSVEAGFIQYRFDEKSVEVDEFHITGDFKLFSVTYHDAEADYNYLEANTSFELSDKVTLELHYGFEDNDGEELTDAKIALNYAFNDQYSAFVAASDKEDNDNQVFAGLVGVF